MSLNFAGLNFAGLNFAAGSFQGVEAMLTVSPSVVLVSAGGTVVLPDVAEVEDGVLYGPSSSLEGTLNVSGDTIIVSGSVSEGQTIGPVFIGDDDVDPYPWTHRVPDPDKELYYFLTDSSVASIILGAGDRRAIQRSDRHD